MRKVPVVITTAFVRRVRPSSNTTPFTAPLARSPALVKSKSTTAASTTSSHRRRSPTAATPPCTNLDPSARAIRARRSFAQFNILNCIPPSSAARAINPSNASTSRTAFLCPSRRWRVTAHLPDRLVRIRRHRAVRAPFSPPPPLLPFRRGLHRRRRRRNPQTRRWRRAPLERRSGRATSTRTSTLPPV